MPRLWNHISMTPDELSIIKTEGRSGRVKAVKAMMARTGYGLRDCLEAFYAYADALGWMRRENCLNCSGKGYHEIYVGPEGTEDHAI